MNFISRERVPAESGLPSPQVTPVPDIERDIDQSIVSMRYAMTSLWASSLSQFGRAYLAQNIAHMDCLQDDLARLIERAKGATE